MSTLLIIGEVCPYCTKFRSPRDIIPMAGGANICVYCEQRHIEALHAMSTGTFTGECSECGKKADELRGDGKMAVHFEGGRYKAMCLPCDQTYVLKRRELYGGTDFGNQLYK
jgi:hypothetical protein